MAAYKIHKPLAVLVVEDDPTFISFWRRLFDEEFEISNCELVTSPLEASRILKERGCELLISDIIMPNINGCELARLAQMLNPHCDVILTTAYGTDLSRFDIDGLKIHLLHKPYSDIEALKLFVEYIINKDQSFDELSEDSFSDDEENPLVTNWKL